MPIGQAARPALQGKVNVPLGQNPPPAPACGWALVRLAAVAGSDTLPAITAPEDAWLLPLKAQQRFLQCQLYHRRAKRRCG